MEEILEFISNNGFAIVMCLLLFFKMLPRLDKLTAVITELVPLVKQETQNGKEIKEALVDFRIEVSKLNGKK